MTKLLLVRHGEIETHKIGRCWGHTDVVLSPNGLVQAEKLAKSLSNETVSAIACSDLKRAIDTAAAIARDRDLLVKNYPDLRELNFGTCEGMTFEEMAEAFPSTAQIWSGLGNDLRFPAGESLADMALRADRFLARINQDSPDSTHLIVAHGGLLAVLICRLIELDIARWWEFKLDYTSVSEVSLSSNGVVLERLNDISHLKDR